MAMGGNHSKLNSTTKSLVRLDPLFGSFNFLLLAGVRVRGGGWMDGSECPALELGGV